MLEDLDELGTATNLIFYFMDKLGKNGDITQNPEVYVRAEDATKALGLKNPQTVWGHMRKLEDKGYVYRLGNNLYKFSPYHFFKGEEGAHQAAKTEWDGFMLKKMKAQLEKERKQKPAPVQPAQVQPDAQEPVSVVAPEEQKLSKEKHDLWIEHADHPSQAAYINGPKAFNNKELIKKYGGRWNKVKGRWMFDNYMKAEIALRDLVLERPDVRVYFNEDSELADPSLRKLMKDNLAKAEASRK